MNNNEAKELLKKYSEGKCTEAEIAILETWYLIDDHEPLSLSIEELDAAKAEIWQALPVHEKLKQPKTKYWIGMPINFNSIAAAAIATICLSFSLYFYLNEHKTVQKTAKTEAVILPGTQKAVLTLADGSSIALNNASNGTLANQSGTNVVKTNDGQLIYQDNNVNTAPKDIHFNSLSVPRGGYYILTLVDGTKVWLNSESTLKYPTAFASNERVVELTGEGYFEVAHRSNQPFKVITNKQTVEVLGTHFNINAYPNENSIATTLVQGSVKVSIGENSKIIVPGQQANVVNNNITVKKVNIDNVTAWVDNTFIFEDEELGSIMRKVERWYDIDVVCPQNLAKMRFNGIISRDKNIKQVLRIMDLTESVHFKFEGRRVTVMP